MVENKVGKRTTERKKALTDFLSPKGNKSEIGASFSKLKMVCPTMDLIKLFAGRDNFFDNTKNKNNGEIIFYLNQLPFFLLDKISRNKKEKTLAFDLFYSVAMSNWKKSNEESESRKNFTNACFSEMAKTSNLKKWFDILPIAQQRENGFYFNAAKKEIITLIKSKISCLIERKSKHKEKSGNIQDLENIKNEFLEIYDTVYGGLLGEFNGACFSEEEKTEISNKIDSFYYV